MSPLRRSLPFRCPRSGRGLPRDLCIICEHCLEKDPRRRYASAGALADDLSRFLAGEPIQARRVGELERVWKWAQRRPAVAALMLAMAVSLIGWAGTSTYLAVAAWKAEATATKKTQEAQRTPPTKAQQAETVAVKARQDAESLAGRVAFSAGVAEAQAGRLDRGLHLDAPGAAPRRRATARLQDGWVRANLAAYAERLPVLRECSKVFFCSRAWFLDPRRQDVPDRHAAEHAASSFDVRTGRKLGEPACHALPGVIRGGGAATAEVGADRRRGREEAANRPGRYGRRKADQRSPAAESLRRRHALGLRPGRRRRVGHPGHRAA